MGSKVTALRFGWIAGAVIFFLLSFVGCSSLKGSGPYEQLAIMSAEEWHAPLLLPFPEDFQHYTPCNNSDPYLTIDPFRDQELPCPRYI